MSDTFSESSDLLDRIQEFVGIGPTGTITSAELHEFEELLRENEEAQSLYLELIGILVCLPRALAGTATSGDNDSRDAVIDDGLTVDAVIGGESIQHSSFSNQAPLPPVPIPTFPSSTIPGAAGYFSSGWPVAYLIATVIFGIGAVIGSIAYVSQPVRVAQKSPPTASNPEASTPQIEQIGRITGMIDCQWVDSATQAFNGAYVPLGRNYSLSSGLMEITYDTGAKVVLQGPVTYEVESKDGGYLSLGKLTAKVEKKVARGQRLVARKSETPNPSPSATHEPLFTVRTPTAVITDIGTEFGVEVQRDGLCNVQVIQGIVEVVARHDGKPAGQPQRVFEGQTAEIAQSNAKSAAVIIVKQSTPDLNSFIRNMPVQSTNRVFYDWQIGSYGTFTAADDDLINAGQPTLAKIELISGEAGWGSSVLKLNDGTAYVNGEVKSMFTWDTFSPKDGTVVMVTLNTALHPHGYDIQSIVSFTGSGGEVGQDRSSQKYDVAYSRVDNPDKFVTLRCDKSATVDRASWGYQEEQVRLVSGSNGAMIATGVAKLRLTFHNTNSHEPEPMYREIDVIGSPTADSDLLSGDQQ